jgi:hypothetical protein
MIEIDDKGKRAAGFKKKKQHRCFRFDLLIYKIYKFACALMQEDNENKLRNKMHIMLMCAT